MFLDSDHRNTIELCIPDPLFCGTVNMHYFYASLKSKHSPHEYNVFDLLNTSNEPAPVCWDLEDEVLASSYLSPAVARPFAVVLQAQSGWVYGVEARQHLHGGHVQGCPLCRTDSGQAKVTEHTALERERTDTKVARRPLVAGLLCVITSYNIASKH